MSMVPWVGSQSFERYKYREIAPVPSTPQKVHRVFVRDPVGQIERIMWQAANYYGVTPQAIKSPCRVPRFTLPRHVAMYLCRKITKRPFGAIMRPFRRSDHSTVIHACHRVRKLIAIDAALAADVAAIEARILLSPSLGQTERT